MKKNHIVALSAAMVLVGLAGCDSNDRNRDYNTRTDRDSSMSTGATSTGQGGRRGYGVPDARSGTNSGTYDSTNYDSNRRNYDNRGTNSTGGSGTRPRNTLEPGMGVVDEKAKDGCCAGACAGSCDKSHKQN